MATSKERNLKLVITGDTKDVDKKIRNLKKEAKSAGLSLANELKTANAEGKKLTSTLTFVSNRLADLTKFKGKVTGRAGTGEQDKVILNRNFEREEEEKAKRSAQREKENLRIKKQAATERLRLAKETNAEITRITRDAAASQKTVAINGINSRLGIKARAAAQEKAIFRNLQAELKDIAKRAQAGSLVGNAATVARTKAQTKAQRALNVVYADTGKRLDALPAKISKNSAGHKTWARHVTEIVGLYRLVNFGINTVIESIKAIPKIGIELQTTKAVLEATLGSSSASAEAFRFLSFEAERAGKSILGVRENFRNLSASMTLAGEETSTVLDVFTNLNTISTSLHLTSEKTQNVFLAIAQIFNKTKVQSEELVKQLGNLLPGAFASFARSMEISTRALTKQLQLGLVDSSKVPKFLEQMAEDFAAAFVIAEKGLQASTERLQTSFTNLGESIFLAIEGPLLSVVNNLTKLGKFLTEMVKGTKELASSLEGFLVPAIGLVVGGLTAWALQATFAATSTAVLTASVIGFSGVGTILVSTLNSIGAALSVFIAPVAIVAGLTAISFAMLNVNRGGKDAAKSARNFFKEVEEQAKLAAKDPIAFDFEVKVSEDTSVKALTENLDLTKARLETVKNKLAELRGESEGTKQSFLEKAESFINVNILADYTNFVEEEKILLADMTKGTAQLATARETAAGQIEEQIEKERLLGEERKKSLSIIKQQAALAKQSKENARLKAERVYQGILDQTRLKLITIRGEDEKAAKFKLAITQRQGLAQLTGLDAVTANLREQVLETQHLAEAELERTFQAARLGEEKAKLAVQESLIKAELVAGILTELQAYKLVKASKEEAIRLEEELLNKQITAAGENPTANLEAGFDRTTQKIQLMKAELLGLKAPLSKVEQMGLSLKGSLESSLGNAFEGFITGAKSAGDAMADFATSILKAVARLAAQELAVKLVGLAIGAFSSGAGASASGGTTGSFSASDLGGSLDTTSLTTFAANGLAASGLSGASGTVLSSPTYFPNAKVTPFASGGVLAGEAGPEAVLPLERNSQGKLGVKADLGDVGASSGVVIQQLTVNLVEKEDESSEEQSQRIGKAIKQQLNSLIDNKLALSKRPGAIMNPTQLQATF